MALLNYGDVDSSNSGTCVVCAHRNLYSNVQCEACGARLPWANSTVIPQDTAPVAVRNELLSPWLQIVSFMVPLVGIVLYFFYRRNNPKKANSAIQTAAWGMAFNLVLMLARTITH